MVEETKNEDAVVEVQEEKVVLPELPTQLSEVDKLALQLAKTNRQLVLEQAKTFLANNDKAESDLRYFILQLYMKYSLGQNDSIGEDGKIFRG